MGIFLDHVGKHKKDDKETSRKNDCFLRYLNRF